jgi:uncharacterized protein YndB with AHSA1/START domain
MPSAQRTVVIAAPIETVFAFFADPANDPRWRGGVKDMHAHDEPAVGAVIHQVIAGPMGRGINADIEITDYDVPTKYGFRAIGGPVRPVGSYVFASVDGGTQVTFSLEAEVTGLKKLMMGGPVQKSMDGEMAALDKAKALIEG